MVGFDSTYCIYEIAITTATMKIEILDVTDILMELVTVNNKFFLKLEFLH